MLLFYLKFADESKTTHYVSKQNFKIENKIESLTFSKLANFRQVFCDVYIAFKKTNGDTF